MVDSKDFKEVKAVDFDGTLAHYDGWKGETNLGTPIKKMVEKVKEWLSNGESVVIFTARADNERSISAIKEWCKEHIGQELDVTNIKRPEFQEFYDDRAYRVKRNSGEILNEDLNQIKSPIQDFLDDLIS